MHLDIVVIQPSPSAGGCWKLTTGGIQQPDLYFSVHNPVIVRRRAVDRFDPEPHDVTYSLSFVPIHIPMFNPGNGVTHNRKTTRARRYPGLRVGTIVAKLASESDAALLKAKREELA